MPIVAVIVAVEGEWLAVKSVEDPALAESEPDPCSVQVVCPGHPRKATVSPIPID